MSKILQRAALENKKRRHAEIEDNIGGEKQKIKKSNVSKITTVGKSELLTGDSDIVYIGHTPHGFYEKEMRQFFSQFGDVVKLKLFRSKKTGNSKGHAFIQFESREIANVVSDAMNGYFLFDRKLVSNVVPLSKIHDGMFLPPKRRNNKSSDKASSKDDPESNLEDDEMVEVNATISEQKVSRFLRSQAKKAENLKNLGIDFQLFLPWS